MNETKSNRILTFDFLVVAVFALYYILPATSAQYSFLLPLAAGAFYILFNIVRDGMKISSNIVKYLAIMVFIAMLYILLTDSTSVSGEVTSRGVKRFISKFYQLFMMFFPLYFLKRVTDHSSYNTKKLLIFFSYALLAYVVVVTINELLINPEITRAWAEFEESSERNIANYYFVYAIPFTMAISTMIACKTKKLWVKILMIAVGIYQLYFLLLAQYTLAVLIAVIGVGVEVYIHAGQGKNRLFLVAFFVVLAILSPWIFKTAATYVPSEEMSIRLNEIYEFLVGGDSSGYNLNGRMTLYGDSIKAFLNSPIWGNRSLDFDGHATFLMVLADLGLLGGIPFYYLYFSSQKKVRVLIGEKGKSYLPIFLMLVLMGLANPIQAALPLMYVVWFLAPLTIETYQEYEERTYGTVEN